MLNEFKEGAIWRKWDLHIHAPSACFNNQFCGKNDDEKWGNYIDKLEELNDIAVLGITDYWSLDGYKKVMEYKNNGRLKNIKLILPNFEARLTNSTEKDKPVNIHFIFNPDFVFNTKLVEKDDYKNKFWNQLYFDFKNEKYYLNSEDNIKDLGKLFFQESTELKCKESDEKFRKKGLEQFKIDLNFIKNLDKEVRKNIIVALVNSSGDGVSGIKRNSQHLTRQDIINVSDAIFSGNPNDRDHYLSNKEGNKPCIHGSDAHSLGKLCKPDRDRFCWIKADCTFAGLKQVLFEPADRVSIGKDRPDSKTPYNVIKNIEIESKHVENKKITIPLNEQLTTIIGPRSSGKSALLFHIAKVANYNEVENRYELFNSKELYKEMHTNTKLKWLDEKEQEKRKILYIPQNYLNRLIDYEYVNSDNPIVEFIRRYYTQKDSNIETEETNFKNNLDKVFSIIGQEIDKLFIKIRNLNELESEIDNLSLIDQEIERINDLIYGNVIDEKKKRTIDCLRLKLTKIKEKINKQTTYKNTFDENQKSINDTLNWELLKNHIDNKEFSSFIGNLDQLKVETIEKLENLFQSNTESIEASIKKKEVIEQKYKNSLLELIKDDKNRSDIEKLHSDLKTQEDKKSKTQERNDSKQTIKTEIENKKKDIIKKYKSIEGLYDTFIKKLQEIKAPDNMKIIVTKKFNMNTFNEDWDNIVNLKKSANVISNLETKAAQATLNKDYIEEKFEDILNNKTAIVKSYEQRDLVNVLFGDYSGLCYDIHYENDSLVSMSPGKRSSVILRFIIEQDKENYPILLDQPEDDLDPSTIYSEIVPYLKEVKKRRQIIIVTHNPNLVIGTDAELVIRSENKNECFEYIHDSLEGAELTHSKNMKEHICDILEGGKDAFSQREKNYANSVKKSK